MPKMPKQSVEPLTLDETPSISGHANLLTVISIPFVAGGLIFKGLREISPRMRGHFALT